MVNIMKKNRWFILVVLMSFVMLLGCKHNEEKSDAVPQKIEISGSIYDKYGLGVEVDLSDAYLNITYSDNEVKKYSALSDEVTYDPFDTSTIGSKTSVFKCMGLSYEFNYEVVKYCLTLDFLDGTYEDKSSISIDAYNNRVVFKDITPIANDSQMQFAGWFYDKALTSRVVTDIEDECRIDDNTTFYAGYDVNYDDNFDYIIKDDYVILTKFKYLTDYSDTIIIPKTIKLYPVAEIGEKFVDETEFGVVLWIDKLYFEEGSVVKKIDASAFENLALTEIELPDSIEIIDSRAFFNCRITSLKLPKSLRKIGASAFESAIELLSIDFNDCALTTIDDNAFSSCSKLVDIKLSNHVESIGSSAFEGCSKVIEFSIPKSVSIIGVNVFSSMPDLRKIDVEEGNLKFSTIDGNLYNNDQTIFYRYCYGKTEESFTLPSTVKIIFESAFDIKNEKCSLKNVYLNEGIEEIASRAFQNTTFDFTIPSTVKSIADDSFVNWGGKAFKISENNTKYKVLNSSLVSYDGEILYSVPANYEDELYVIPDGIKTINSYAITALENVKIIKITNNSKLESIKEYGIKPFNLKELLAVVIDKDNVFDIVDNGFKNADDRPLNSSFSIVIGDQVIDSYLNAWKDYHLFDGDSNTLTSYIKTQNDFINGVVEEISYELVVTSYEAYNKSKVFMLDDNFNNVFYYGRDLIKKIATIYYFDENSYDAYDEYFKVFINEYVKYVFDYYDSINIYEFGSTSYSYSYLGFISLSQVYEKLNDDNKALFDKTKSRYNDLQSHRNKVVAELMAYELSRDEFDIDNYNAFIAEYNEYSVGSMILSNNQIFKYFMIDFSYKMYLLTTLDYNYQNASYLNSLLNGNMFENIYGINDYLLYYFNQDAYTANLYKYDELAEITNKVTSIVNDTILYIDSEFENLDMTADYNTDEYQGLYDIYNYASGFEYYLSTETISKYQFIGLRMNVNKVINTVNVGVSKSNVYDITMLINNIESSSLSEYMQACSEYSEYEVAVSNYNDYFAEICDEFEGVLFAVNKDNLLDKYDELVSLYSQYPQFISILIYNIDGEWISLQTIYDSILCAKAINDVVKLVNDEITADNYKNVFNLCYGYDNVAGIEDLIAEYAMDEHFNEYLNSYVDSTTYLKYQGILSQL